MSAADLVSVLVRLPQGTHVYRVRPVDAHIARRLYRWQSYDPRTGRRLPAGTPAGDLRRRLARSQAALWLATRHEGILPTGPDPSAVSA